MYEYDSYPAPRYRVHPLNNIRGIATPYPGNSPSLRITRQHAARSRYDRCQTNTLDLSVPGIDCSLVPEKRDSTAAANEGQRSRGGDGSYQYPIHHLGLLLSLAHRSHHGSGAATPCPGLSVGLRKDSCGFVGPGTTGEVPARMTAGSSPGALALSSCSCGRRRGNPSTSLIGPSSRGNVETTAQY